MAVTDFIISYFAASPLLKEMLDGLRRPYLLHQPNIANRKYAEYLHSMGYRVENIWNSARKSDMELGRVAVLGFSEGCTGVRETLKCHDAAGIDSVFACDGIHATFTDPKNRIFSSGYTDPYVAFAMHAVALPPTDYPDNKLLCITHSAIGPASLPNTIASTTETADVIWTQSLSLADPPIVETEACGFPCPPVERREALGRVDWPGSLPVGAKTGGGTVTPNGWCTVRPSIAATGFLKPATFCWTGYKDGWTQRRFANNLSVFGWSYATKNATKDPTGNRDHIFQADLALPYAAQVMLVRRWNGVCALTGFGQDSATCEIHGQDFQKQKGPLAIPQRTTEIQAPPSPPDMASGTEDEPEPESKIVKYFFFGAAAVAGFTATRALGKRR